MAKKKKTLMHAISKALLRLCLMEKSSHNPFAKKEICAEIENLVSVMVQQPEFLSFLLDKLQTEEQIRSDERAQISFTQAMTPKKGPLGNPIPTKDPKAKKPLSGKESSRETKFATGAPGASHE